MNKFLETCDNVLKDTESIWVSLGGVTFVIVLFLCVPAAILTAAFTYFFTPTLVFLVLLLSLGIGYAISQFLTAVITEYSRGNE